MRLSTSDIADLPFSSVHDVVVGRAVEQTPDPVPVLVLRC
jgi:hypothetical protein